MLNLHEISIKGLNPRYKCFYDGVNLEIYNEKGVKLGGNYPYNSEQTNYCLYCEDGKRRSFYTLRLLYAYTNDISVMDIPKGCIYRTRYGLEHYNKRMSPKELVLPQRESPIGNDIKEYLANLDRYWDIVKEAILNGDMTKVADILYENKDEVIRIAYSSLGGAKDVLEDCFQDACLWYIKNLLQPRKNFHIGLPKNTLIRYVKDRYIHNYKSKTNKHKEV